MIVSATSHPIISAAVQDVSPPPVSSTSFLIGANLNPVADFDTTPIFTNLVYQGRGFMVQGQQFQAAPSTNPPDGMPSTDFDCWCQYLPNLTATSQVIFKVTGRAASYSLVFTQGGDQIVSVGAYDPATNTQIVVWQGNAGRVTFPVVLRLTGTQRTENGPSNAGVTDIVAARPGYTLAQITTQRFTTEYLNFLAGYTGGFRMMDWMVTNNTQGMGQGQLFSKRTTRALRRTCYTYSEDTTGATAKNGPIPYEDLVELCNITGKPLWITFPFFSSDAYILAAVSLIQSLRATIPSVVVEYCNENWNPSFDQYSAGLNAIAVEMNGFCDSNARRDGWLTRYVISANRAADNLTVTFKVSLPHGYLPGKVLTIVNFDNNGSNTDYSVTSVLGSDLFTIQKSGPPGPISIPSGISIVDKSVVSNLIYQGDRNIFSMRALWALRRTKEISDLVRSVVGDAAMMTDWMPVFMWQGVAGDFYDYMNWLETTFTAHPVSYYLKAMGAAQYAYLDGTPAGGPNLQGDASASLTVQDYLNEQALIANYDKVYFGAEAKSIVAMKYGIEHWHYEGGTDTGTFLPNGSSNNAKASQAQMQPQMKTIMKEFLNDISRYGTNEIRYMEYFHGVGDPNSTFQTDRFWDTDSVLNITAPKMLAHIEVAAAAPAKPTRNRGEGTFDMRARAGKYQDVEDLTGQAFPDFQSSISFPRGTLDYNHYLDAAGVYSILATYACSSAGRNVTIIVRGTTIALNAPLVNGGNLATLNTVGPFLFSGRIGHNGIEFKRQGGLPHDIEWHSYTITRVS